MVLNENQIARVNEHLDAKWTEPRKCPICGHEDWRVNDRLLQLFEFDAVDRLIMAGGVVCPLVTITCSNCGYTILFSAVTVGLVDKSSGAWLKTG